MERWKPSIVQIVSAIVALVTVFGIGVALGAGRIKFDSASRKIVASNTSSTNLDYQQLDELYAELKDNFDGELDDNMLLEGAKKGLTEASGDPYTEFLNAEESEDFNSDLSGSFEGIGAELGIQEDLIVIIAPIAGAPAEKAGLRPKDVLLEIDGESAAGLNITEAVKRIRGPKGTEVKLKIARDGQTVDVRIVRDTISIPSVEWEITSDNVGIMNISRFGTDTEDLALDAAQEFRDKKVKGVILDLRGNPGGLLDAAVSVSNIWLDKGKKILDEKRGDKVVKEYKASRAAVLSGFKTVVMIDEGSASASEIVAGALHDNGVATLVGKKSYGKGSVQNLIELASGGTVKVTIARWYTPNNKNIDKEGIVPDYEVERSLDDIKADKDPQRDKALELLR
jgi:carboxyl-terminal processing protease